MLLHVVTRDDKRQLDKRKEAYPGGITQKDPFCVLSAHFCDMLSYYKMSSLAGWTNYNISSLLSSRGFRFPFDWVRQVFKLSFSLENEWNAPISYRYAEILLSECLEWFVEKDGVVVLNAFQMLNSLVWIFLLECYNFFGINFNFLQFLCYRLNLSRIHTYTR